MGNNARGTSNNRNFSAYDMYRYYTDKLLEANPSYKKKYDTILCIRGIYVIYKVVDYVKEFVIDYRMFRKVIELYNLKMVEAVIEGERVSLGSGLGYIHGRRIERSFRNLSVDFGATYRARQIDPEAPPVYYTDEDYCRIAWVKQGGVRNSFIYEFVPTRTIGGFKQRFSSALQNNPLLKFKFHYVPLTPIGQEKSKSKWNERLKQAA